MQEVTAARADILVQPAETPEQQERQGALIAQLHTSDLAVMAFDSDKKAREFERLVHLTSQVRAGRQPEQEACFVSSAEGCSYLGALRGWRPRSSETRLSWAAAEAE